MLRAMWLLDPARGSSWKGHLQMDWTLEDECELSSLEGRGFGSKGRLLRDSQGQEEARFESMFRKKREHVG